MWGLYRDCVGIIFPDFLYRDYVGIIFPYIYFFFYHIGIV